MDWPNKQGILNVNITEPCTATFSPSLYSGLPTFPSLDDNDDSNQFQASACSSNDHFHDHLTSRQEHSTDEQESNLATPSGDFQEPYESIQLPEPVSSSIESKRPCFRPFKKNQSFNVKPKIARIQAPIHCVPFKNVTRTTKDHVARDLITRRERPGKSKEQQKPLTRCLPADRNSVAREAHRDQHQGLHAAQLMEDPGSMTFITFLQHIQNEHFIDKNPNEPPLPETIKAREQLLLRAFQVLQDCSPNGHVIYFHVIDLIDRLLGKFPQAKLTETLLLSCLSLCIKWDDETLMCQKDIAAAFHSGPSQKQVWQAESKVWQGLDYNVMCANPIYFLRYYSWYADHGGPLRVRAKFTLLLASLHGDFRKHLPSLLAAAALTLTRLQPDYTSFAEKVAALGHFSLSDLRRSELFLLQVLTNYLERLGSGLPPLKAHETRNNVHNKVHVSVQTRPLVFSPDGNRFFQEAGTQTTISFLGGSSKLVPDDHIDEHSMKKPRVTFCQGTGQGRQSPRVAQDAIDPQTLPYTVVTDFFLKYHKFQHPVQLFAALEPWVSSLKFIEQHSSHAGAD